MMLRMKRHHGFEWNKRITTRCCRDQISLYFLLVIVTPVLLPVMRAGYVDDNGQCFLYTFENSSDYKNLELNTTGDESVWNIVKATGIGVRLLADHTLNSTEGHYIRMKGRGFAHLAIPIISTNSSTLCLEFWHCVQEGANLTLGLDQSAQLLWSSGEDARQVELNHTSWKIQSLDLNPSVSDKITFVGFKLKGSEVCLDDIKFSNGACGHRRLKDINSTLVSSSTKKNTSSGEEIVSPSTHLYHFTNTVQNWSSPLTYNLTQETDVLIKPDHQITSVALFEPKTTNIWESSSELKASFQSIEYSEIQMTYEQTSTKSIGESENMMSIVGTSSLVFPTYGMFTTAEIFTYVPVFSDSETSSLGHSIFGTALSASKNLSESLVQSVTDEINISTMDLNPDSYVGWAETLRPVSDDKFISTEFPTNGQVFPTASLMWERETSEATASAEDKKLVINLDTGLNPSASRLNIPNQIAISSHNFVSFTDHPARLTPSTVVLDSSPDFQLFEKSEKFTSQFPSLPNGRSFQTSQLLSSSDKVDITDINFPSELTEQLHTALDYSRSFNQETMNTVHNFQTLAHVLEPSPLLSVERSSMSAIDDQFESIIVDTLQPSSPWTLTPERQSMNMQSPEQVFTEPAMTIRPSPVGHLSSDLISALVDSLTLQLPSSYTEFKSQPPVDDMKSMSSLANLYQDHVLSTQRTNTYRDVGHLRETFSSNTLHLPRMTERTMLFESVKLKSDSSMHTSFPTSGSDRIDTLTTYLPDLHSLSLLETTDLMSLPLPIYKLIEKKTLSPGASSQKQVLTQSLITQLDTEVTQVGESIQSSVTQLHINSILKPIQVQPTHYVVRPTSASEYSTIGYHTTQKVAAAVSNKDWAIPVTVTLGVLLLVCLLILVVVCLGCSTRGGHTSFQDNSHDTEATSHSSLHYYRRKEQLTQMPLWSRFVSDTCKNNTASPWRLDDTAQFARGLSNVYSNEMSPEKLQSLSSAHGNSSDDNGFHETIELESLTSGEENNADDLDLHETHLTNPDFQKSDKNHPSITFASSANNYDVVHENHKLTLKSNQFRDKDSHHQNKYSSKRPSSTEALRLPSAQVERGKKRHSDSPCDHVGKDIIWDQDFEVDETSYSEYLNSTDTFNEGDYESVRDYSPKNASKYVMGRDKTPDNNNKGGDSSPHNRRTKPKILKCVSFDEAHLCESSDEFEEKKGNTSQKRKISTASETGIQYLSVPDSAFMHRSNIYETINNLTDIDGQRKARFHIGQEPDDEYTSLQDPDFHPMAKEQNSQTDPYDMQHSSIQLQDDKFKFHSTVLTKDRQFSRYPSHVPESDFILPIIKQANIKILAERQKRKLRARSSSGHSTDDESSSPSFEYHYNCPGNIKDKDRKDSNTLHMSYDHTPDHWTIRRKTSPELPESSCSVNNACSRTTVQASVIPKIILTTDDAVSNPTAFSIENNYIPPSPTTRRRRIARENNPFLIEVDRPSTSTSEKVRRSSAPIMPYRDKDSPDFSAEKMIRSASGNELVSKYNDTSSSNLGKNPTKSWSAEFYDLMKKSEPGNPSDEEWLNRMINERYDALFNKKYPGLASKSDIRSSPVNLSPRMVKRRSAQKLKNLLSEYEGKQTEETNGVGCESQNNSSFPPDTDSRSSIASVKCVQKSREKLKENIVRNKQGNSVADTMVGPPSVEKLNFQNHTDDPHTSEKSMQTSMVCSSRPVLTQGRDGLDCDNGTLTDELKPMTAISHVNKQKKLISSIPLKTPSSKPLTTKHTVNRGGHLITSPRNLLSSSVSSVTIPEQRANKNYVIYTGSPGDMDLVTSQSKTDHRNLRNSTHNTHDRLSGLENPAYVGDTESSASILDNRKTNVTSDSSQPLDDVINKCDGDDAEQKGRKDINPFFLNDQYTAHVSIV